MYEYDKCLDGRRISNEGDKKEVVCDNTEQFMNVLSVVRATCPEDRLTYSNPIVKGQQN